jgi:hypothetical protein
MSNKSVVSKEKKPMSAALKGSLIALAVIGLEASAIGAAVTLTEYRQRNSVPEYKHIQDKLATQSARLAELEKLPLALSTASQQISANSNAINLISDNLNALKDEVGNNQIRTIYERLDTTGHRIESLEETQSNEALILSLALMIKENALYHRSFAEEVDILATLSEDMPQVKSDIATLLEYKSQEIADNEALAKAYQQISQNFTFGTDITPEPKEVSSLEKGLNLIKSSVSHIKLDRVIVLKKQKKTDEQVKLLNTLSTLVNEYKFAEALQYIKDNAEFSKITNPAFNQWQQDVTASLKFNQAITHIMQEQLNSFRQDIKNGAVKLPPKAESTPQAEEPKPIEQATEASTDTPVEANENAEELE